MSDSAAAPVRDPALALARLHLRIGALVQARAELETLAGRGALDEEALVDLAEARWRTGDLGGAGEAAQQALDAGRRDAVALVVAAEALSADGRPGEARRLAGEALELTGLDIDDVFAGMPRSSVWPVDAEEPATPVGMFEEPVPPLPIVGKPGPAVPSGRAAAMRSLWDEVPAGELPDPADAFEAGRAAFERGDHHRAALHLGLALRLAPGVAPVVLDLLEGTDGPEFAILRGDAFRLVGHERDARLAFAAAAAGIDGTTPARTDPTGSPAATLEPHDDQPPKEDM